jgi:hypothetical protein
MTMPEHRELPTPTASITIRVAAPDGSVQEFLWQDGNVVTSQYDAQGKLCERSAVAMDATGDVDVDATTTPTSASCHAGHAAQGHPLITVRGTEVTHTDVMDGLRVDKTFDEQGRLCGVHLSGPWGEETLSLLADGSSNRTWRLTSLHGTEAWDAGHHRTSYEIVMGDEGAS